ncbi:sulfurtransferase [Kaarinaea lacus]
MHHSMAVRATIFLATLACAVVLPAHGKNTLNQNLLISAPTLKEIIPRRQAVILDVRTEVEYSEGHLEGAINLPITRLFSSESRSGLVISINDARTIFSNAGIDMSTNVVIYDNGNFVDAARAFWVLELYGHQKSSLLDGGFPAWVNANYPVTTQIPTVESKKFIPTVVPERLSTKLSVRLAIDDTNTVIIDARTEKEYIGKESRSERKGHIPNAINIPAMENFVVTDEYSRLRSDEELVALYSPVADKQRVITYCNKGKDSALTYFVLRKLGHNVSAYDGSWFEWANDFQLPVAE